MEKKTFIISLSKALIMLVVVLVSIPTFAQKKINMGSRFQINKDASYITFTTTMAGFPVVKGSLKAYQANMFYDPDDIMSSSATIRIGSAGFTTSHDARDGQLQGEHFLNTAKFPGIWFQSNKVTLTDKGFDLSGTMNIKNINKPVTVHMEKPTVMRGAFNGQDMMIAKGTFKFNRKDFEMGTTGPMASNPMLGDEVTVEFSFMGTSYTIGYLQTTFVKKVNGRDHAVGLVYNEVKANGVESGMKLMQSLANNKDYKSDNWLSNLANIGWILMVDGYGKEALPFYEFALKQNPTHLTSLLRLGDCYVIAGEFDKALAHFKNEWSLPARARFTHIPEMISKLQGSFELKNMK